MFRLLVVLLLCTFVYGCATTRYQPPTADEIEILNERTRQRKILYEAKKERFRKLVRDEKTRHARLLDLAVPIQIASVKLSKQEQIAHQFGYYFMAQDSFGDQKKEPYQWEVIWEEYGVKARKPSFTVWQYSFTVWHVLKGMPAEQAGMRPGDRVIAINGKFLNSIKDYQKGVNLEADGKATFTVVRDDTISLTFSIPTMPISKFPIQYWDSEQINAFADGKAMYITKGMMDFAESDRELQFIIAHELAHNIEKHLNKRKNNALLGGLLGGAADILIGKYTGVRTDTFTRSGLNIGAHTYSKNFEREADYLGMYLLENADISIDGVADFWRKMSTLGMGYSRTHPSNAERFINLMAIEKEIKAKKMNGWELVPNK